jgi:cytochrome c biogenesis protein CcmG, thiol:disulfide interchange protein DsbE
VDDPKAPPDPELPATTPPLGRPRWSRPRLRVPRHPVRWVALAAALTLVALVVVIATDPPATEYEADSPLVGQHAPSVSAETLTGQHFDLGALRGRFVLIDFFSSWCVPCRREQPELVRFAQQQIAKPRGDGAVLVGIVFHDSDAAILSLLGSWRGLYPALNDPGGSFALAYGVDNPPSKYVVDPKGIVVAKIIGPVTAAGLDTAIAKAKASER